MSGLPGGIAPTPNTFTLTVAAPGTITKGATYTSEALSTYGLSHVAVASKMDQDGTLSLQNYVDTAATITTGSAVTKQMSKNTMALIDNAATVVVNSVKVSIINGNAADPAVVSSLTVIIAKAGSVVAP